MEPGREDREHSANPAGATAWSATPQWNPAVKTGSTRLAYYAGPAAND